MPLFWSGFGILVPVITLVSLMLAQLGSGALFGDPDYFRTHGWPLGLGFLLAAAAVYALGERLGRGSSRVLRDEATGERVELRRRHTFFFIPMKAWAVVLLVLGCVAPFLPR